jgi:hypothetical protein
MPRETDQQIKREIKELEAFEVERGSLTSSEYHYRYQLRQRLMGPGAVLMRGVEDYAQQGLRGILTPNAVIALRAQADLHRASGLDGEKYLDAAKKADSLKGRVQTWFYEHGLISWNATGEVVPGRKFIAFPV